MRPSSAGLRLRETLGVPTQSMQSGLKRLRSSPRAGDVHPFPYTAWPSWSKQDVSVMRRVLRLLPTPHERLRVEACALLGLEVRTHPGRAERWPRHVARAALLSPLLCLWLEHTLGADARQLLLEL